MRLFGRASVPAIVSAPTPELAPKDVLDSQIKLYALLVEQLQRYNTIIWQFPAALLGVNLVVVTPLASQPGGW
jgi:hypothetical protein